MKTQTLLVFILVSFLSSPQLLNSLWQKNIGSESDDGYRSSIISVENGTIVLLTTNDDATNYNFPVYGISDVSIIRLNRNGDTLWKRTFGGYNWDYTVEAAVFDSLIYVIAASGSGISGNKTVPQIGDMDIWCILLDLNGNLIKQKAIGTLDEDRPKSLAVDQNGVYILSECRYSGVSGDKTVPSRGMTDAWLIQLNRLTLELENQIVLGTSQSDIPIDIETDENEIYVLLETFGGIEFEKKKANYGQSDAWVIKLNQSLEIIAENSFGGNSYDGSIGSIYKTNNNDFYIFIQSYSGISGVKTNELLGVADAWLLKLTNNLDLIKENSFGGNGFESPVGFTELDANRFLLFINSTSTLDGTARVTTLHGNRDILVYYVDKNLDKQYEFSFGGGIKKNGSKATTQANAVSINGDRIFLIGNSDASNSNDIQFPGFGDVDAFINSFDFSKVSIEIAAMNNYLTLYPNPATDFIQIESNFTDIKQLEIYSSEGKLVLSNEYENQIGSVNDLNITKLKSGHYIINLLDNSKNILSTSRFVK